VLRSLKTGDASYILGRKSLGVADDPTVDFLFDTGNIRFDGRQWSAPRSTITIFDGVFVAENVHSGDVVDIEQKRNLYRVIIGDRGVTLAEQEADLAQRSRGKTTEITTAARAVQAHVPASMKIEAFQALLAADDVDTLTTEQEKRLETAHQADAIKDRKALSEFPLPDLAAKFEQVLGTTIDDIARDAEAKLAAHIAAHDMADGGGNWIAEGLPHADDTCAFCGQGISGSELIAAFRSVFSERYEALATEIGAMSTLASQLFGNTALARLETLTEQNKSGVEFWAKYVDVDVRSLALPAEIFPAAIALREAALELLARKAGAALEAITADARFLTASGGYSAAKSRCDNRQCSHTDEQRGNRREEGRDRRG
jgi:wobble nucleotide-excising tRNase